MTFKQLFEKSDDEFKIEYLFRLLENDPVIRNDFLSKMPPVQRAEQTALMDYGEFKEKTSRSYEVFLSLIGEIDLEALDWDSYVPPHGGYVEEWEAYDAMAEQEIEKALGGFEDDVLKSLLQGKLSEVMVDFAAFLKAAYDSDIDDPYDILDDPAYYLINIKLIEWVDFIKNKIPHSKIDDDEIINSVNLLFLFMEENKEVQDNIRVFEEFLVVLIEKISDKSRLQRLSGVFSVDKRYYPKFAITLVKYIDKDSWEKLARELLFEDQTIGEQLLEWYLQNGKKVNYIDVAKKLFAQNEHIWAEKIVDNILPEYDERFYVDVNIVCCARSGQVKYYKKVNALLSADEKKSFMDKIKNNYNLTAEVLKEDGEYDQIMRIIEKLPGTWNFQKKILNTVKDNYPDFTFHMLEKHISNLMKGEGRNRMTYKQIAEWFIYAKSISGQDHKMNSLISQLYNHKPNLPALKDEFRMAGIV